MFTLSRDSKFSAWPVAFRARIFEALKLRSGDIGRATPAQHQADRDPTGICVDPPADLAHSPVARTDGTVVRIVVKTDFAVGAIDPHEKLGSGFRRIVDTQPCAIPNLLAAQSGRIERLHHPAEVTWIASTFIMKHDAA